MIAALAALVIIALDQATKAAIIHAFARGEQTPVLGKILIIGHARNTGAVFGIMRWAGGFFMIFSIVAAAVIIVAICLARRAALRIRLGLGLVLGGALGNLIDRIRLGSVVDFIDIGINDRIRWPSFNVADLAITVGVILLIASSLRPARPTCSVGEHGNVF